MEEIKVKRVWEREKKRKWEGLNKTDGRDKLNKYDRSHKKEKKCMKKIKSRERKGETRPGGAVSDGANSLKEANGGGGVTGQISGARGSASEAVLCGGGGRRACIYQRRVGRRRHQGTETPVKPGNKKMIKSHLVSRRRRRQAKPKRTSVTARLMSLRLPLTSPPPPPSHPVTRSFITTTTTTTFPTWLTFSPIKA